MGPVITAHPLQLTVAAGCAEVFTEEPSSHGGGRCAVGYLVRADCCVTVASALGGRQLGQLVWLRFSGGLRTATLAAVDEEADCAILTLRPAVMSQLVLTLEQRLCSPGEVCQTWAALPTLRSAGQVLAALCEVPLGEDERRRPALRLRMVAGSERWDKSLAGCPLFHDGFVVGHLRALGKRGGESLLEVCPAPYVASLLAGLGRVGQSLRSLQPPKAAFAADWCVARPVEESLALGQLLAAGPPLYIWAADRHGKSWFVQALLGRLRTPGARTAYLNLDRLSPLACSSLEQLLGELRGQLHDQLGDARGEALGRPGEVGAPPPPCTPEVLHRLLQLASQQRLVLAVDRLDRLRDTVLWTRFLDLLAAFTDERSSSAVGPGLRLLLCSALPPQWLPWQTPSRPLGAVSLELPDLTLGQLGELAALHRLTPPAAELDQLFELVGGHPYLARVAFYAAALRQKSLGELLSSGPAGPGAFPPLFEPFLAACRQQVVAQPGLWPTLSRLLREKPLDALDRLLLPRLLQLGIVCRRPGDRRDSDPDYQLRYPLYRWLLDC
jgi:hypothetical protein